MFSLKWVNKSFAFLFDFLFEIMQKPLFFQCKTALDAPAETPPGGSLGDSQERLFSPGWPLGRLWGPRAPPGALLWISLVGSLIWEAFWGPLWMHLGSFWSSFKAFRHPTGSLFLISTISFILHTDVFQIRISVYHVRFLGCRM